MTPTEELKNEHEAIKTMLEILEEVSGRLNGGGQVDPAHLGQAVEFIQVFADKCHHGKEEGVLFPAMIQAGVPRDGGPIGVMLAEHDRGRGFVKEMKAAAEAIAAGRAAEARRFAAGALGYASLLRQHIDKENHILFPMADRVLPAARQEGIAREFERIEREVVGEGRHEQFHSLLEKLEAAYLAS